MIRYRNNCEHCNTAEHEYAIADEIYESISSINETDADKKKIRAACLAYEDALKNCKECS